MLVDCDFRKWPDRPHWRFPARFVDRDPFGTWLVTEPPTPYTGPRGEGAWDFTMMILVPHNDWFIAAFNDALRPDEIYVDIATPAQWLSTTHVRSIDLDLDVIRYRDGRILIDDEDEFIEHQTAYGYPDEVITNARASCDRIHELVRDRAEPFGLVGANKLAKSILGRTR